MGPPGGDSLGGPMSIIRAASPYGVHGADS